MPPEERYVIVQIVTNMARILSKCAILAAAALLATLTGQAFAQATDLVWVCEIDGDGNAHATIDSFGDQWFQINVAQDDCVNACDAQVRALGLDSGVEAQQIRDFQGTHSGLLSWVLPEIEELMSFCV